MGGLGPSRLDVNLGMLQYCASPRLALTPDIAGLLATLFRAGHCPALSQKEKGGGVCFWVNQRWCNDAKLVSQSCAVELETLII